MQANFAFYKWSSFTLFRFVVFGGKVNFVYGPLNDLDEPKTTTTNDKEDDDEDATMACL